MRVLLQRVTSATVAVEGEISGEIGSGLLALVGITQGDSEETARKLAQKSANLRIFSDEQGKMNRSLLDVGGGALVVSQFTLYADARKGRRPGYVKSAPPDMAEPLVRHFADCLEEAGVANVRHGVFGAYMQVSLVNDGPVTIWLDSAEL